MLPEEAVPIPSRGAEEPAADPVDGRLLAAAVCTVGLLAFAQSYQRWLDPIVDAGRDLYLADRLGHGATLYRDARYQYLPLAPYLLALATKGIGSSLAAWAAIGVTEAIAVGVSLWVAVRRCAGPVAACGAALLFVSLSFCGATTFGANFVFPYSHAATLGIAFLTGALAAFVSERPRLAIALLVLASWCKLEYAFGAVLVVAGLALTRRLRLRHAAEYGAAMAVSAALFALVFAGSGWWGNVFAASLTQGETARRFYAHVSGIAGWRASLALVVRGAATLGLLAWVVATLGRRPLVAVPLVVLLSWVGTPGHALVRGFALVQLLVLVATARDRTRPLFVFALFSVAATLRVPLAVAPAWYGFALVAPVYALMAVLPGWRRDGWGRPSPLWLVPVLFLCGHDLLQQREAYGRKRFPVETPRGTFLDGDARRAASLQGVVDLPPVRSLAVFPEGVALNYLTATPTPLTYHTFTPVETADPAVEADVLRELEARPPERVVVVDRDVREFGSRGFGVDYDLRIAAWLRSRYRIEARTSHALVLRLEAR